MTQKCQLTRNIHCPGNRDAVFFIEWSMRYDPDPVTCTSVICRECYDGRPSIVSILSIRDVQPGDETSA